jgi:hypothetical protein
MVELLLMTDTKADSSMNWIYSVYRYSIYYFRVNSTFLSWHFVVE